MIALIRHDDRFITLNEELLTVAEVPPREWRSVSVVCHVRTAMAESVVEHRFTATPGSIYRSGKIETAVRCDEDEEWHPIDSSPWSPESTIASPYFPASMLREVRYDLFGEIAKVDAILATAYEAACYRIVDEGGNWPSLDLREQRDNLASALAGFRESFGRPTMARRIVAALARVGGPVRADMLLERVRSQPGMPTDPLTPVRLTTTLEEMAARDDEYGLTKTDPHGNPHSFGHNPNSYFSLKQELLPEIKLKAAREAKIESDYQAIQSNTVAPDTKPTETTD